MHRLRFGDPASSARLTYTVVSGPAGDLRQHGVDYRRWNCATLRQQCSGREFYAARQPQQQLTVKVDTITIGAKDATRVYGVANLTFTGVVT